MVLTQRPDVHDFFKTVLQLILLLIKKVVLHSQTVFLSAFVVEFSRVGKGNLSILLLLSLAFELKLNLSQIPLSSNGNEVG
jgi:hypothetical protein